LAAQPTPDDHVLRNSEADLEHLYCLRCNRELETGSKSVAVYLFAQTVGIRPRQKSAAKRICFCPQCAVSLAMGPPPEGALNLAAWEMIRELVSSDPSLNDAAWESLQVLTRSLPENVNESALRNAVGGCLEF
jgi:hypothetical protein